MERRKLPKRPPITAVITHKADAISQGVLSALHALKQPARTVHSPPPPPPTQALPALGGGGGGGSPRRLFAAAPGGTAAAAEEWVSPPALAPAAVCDVSLLLPALGPGAPQSPPQPALPPPQQARQVLHPPPRALPPLGLPFDTEGAVVRALALARSVANAAAEASAATVAGLDAQREAAGWAGTAAAPPPPASPAALPRARVGLPRTLGSGPSVGAALRLPGAEGAPPHPPPPSPAATAAATAAAASRQELLTVSSPRKPPRSPVRSSAAAAPLPEAPPPPGPPREALLGALSRARGVRRGLARLRGEVGAMLLQTGRAFEALADGVGGAAVRGDAARGALALALGAARAEAGAAAASAAAASADAAALRTALGDALVRQASLERALQASAEAARALRDNLAAATGAVRVVLRLRPLLPGDLARRDAPLAVVTRWALEGYLGCASPKGSGGGGGGGVQWGLTLSHFSRLLGWAGGDGAALCRAARVGAAGGGGSGCGGVGALAGALDVAPLLLFSAAAPGGGGDGYAPPPRGSVKDRVFTLPPIGEGALRGPAAPGGGAGACAPPARWLLEKFAAAAAGEGGGAHALDRVFGPAATQEAVFSELRPFLDSGLHGRSVTVLGYGSTGSGKSHTLLGGGAWPSDAAALLAVPGVGARGLPPARATSADAAAGADNAAPGVLPRALAYLWDALSSEAGGESGRALGLSVLEVYNEEVRDLLAGSGGGGGGGGGARALPPPPAAGPLSPGKATGSGRPLAAAVAAGAADGTGGATVFPCTDLGVALAALGAALARRVQAPTVVNETSSRSHCVVRFIVRGGRGGGGGPAAVVSIADLAGAENLRESRAAGAAAAEAGAVNASLAAVGDCVAAVARGGAGVQHSFRASRLTRILEPTLRQGARCLVLLTATLAPSHREQLAATLRFGARLGGAAHAAGAGARPSKVEALAAVEAFLEGRWEEQRGAGEEEEGGSGGAGL
jgi:hypothetical protein